MPANSNFQQAIREAQSSALIGPNVVNKALPYVGGGMALTGLGVLGGLSLQATNNPLFGPLFIVAFIAEIVLFVNGNSVTSLRFIGQVQVTDGDTIRKGKLKIRLHGIDAPENKQKYTN